MVIHCFVTARPCLPTGSPTTSNRFGNHFSSLCSFAHFWRQCCTPLEFNAPLPPVPLMMGFEADFRLDPSCALPLHRDPGAAFMKTMGLSVAGLQNAGIKLKALILRNAYLTSSSLQDRFLAHYKKEALSEVYKLLGCADRGQGPYGRGNTGCSEEGATGLGLQRGSTGGAPDAAGVLQDAHVREGGMVSS